MFSSLNNWNYVWNHIILQKFKHIYRVKSSIKAENLYFEIQPFDEVNKIREVLNHCFVLFYRKNRYSKPFILVSNVEGDI